MDRHVRMFAGVHAVRCVRKMHKPLQMRRRPCLDDRQGNIMKLLRPKLAGAATRGFIFLLHLGLQRLIVTSSSFLSFLLLNTCGSFYALSTATLTSHVVAWYIENLEGRPRCSGAPRKEVRRRKPCVLPSEVDVRHKVLLETSPLGGT
ncbi:hypothetical protein CDEST_00542 [Colletotrichum destructivum]|uniref:Uncharacterized protein n=1 Tax=Colletotrichum destructivum TaxID=34406 RepID=A0AAX4HWI1_9PEZI|nr:hypothetical protein CDEST_00542 [Colletotrichum destructivum]